MLLNFNCARMYSMTGYFFGRNFRVNDNWPDQTRYKYHKYGMFSEIIVKLEQKTKYV